MTLEGGVEADGGDVNSAVHVYRGGEARLLVVKVNKTALDTKKQLDETTCPSVSS